MTETRFLPSTHGLKFPNYWPPGTPDLIAHTLIGNLSIGNANAGLCGGGGVGVGALRVRSVG